MTGQTDDRWKDRTEQVASRATHGSVTEEILLGTGRYSNEFYLYDQPAVAHLDDGELPHFAFHNRMKGIGVGSKRDTRSPDEGGITVVLLTDRRVLAVLGRRDGDQRLTVPYETVTGADYSTGLMKSRIVVRTADTDYHLWIDSGYEESALAEAVELLEEKAENGTQPAAGVGDAGPTTAPTTQSATSDGGAQPTAEARSDDTATGSTDAGDAGGDEDPLEKLERLKELKEKGVISEEDFERKKDELLDQV